MPLGWELVTLRVAELDSADPSGRGGFTFSTGSFALLELLSEHVRAYVVDGVLHTPWQLTVEPGARGLGLRLRCEGTEVSLRTLADDVRALAEGLSGRLRRAALRRAEELPGIADLTPRERVVLLGLLDGLSVRTLARRLFVSRCTVRNQMRSIYAKLGVHSHADLLELFAGRVLPHEARSDRARRPSTACAKVHRKSEA